METIFKKIYNFLKKQKMFKEIEKIPDEFKPQKIQNGGISKPESVIFAFNNIDDEQNKVKYLNEVINKDEINDKLTNAVINKASPEVLRKVYEKNPITVTNALDASKLSKIMERYDELYKLAERISGKASYNDFQLEALMQNVLGGQLEYDSDNVLKIIAIRLSRNIATYEKPLHYQRLVTPMQSDLDILKLPNYVEQECKKYIENLSTKMRSESINKKIKALEKFDKSAFEKELIDYIEIKNKKVEEQEKNEER